MRMSATGTSKGRGPSIKRGKARGFSLVELLIVLVVMGLAGSVVAMNWPSGDSGAEDEAQALAGRLHEASRESILSGKMIGVWITPQGYSIARWREGRWRELSGKRAKGDWQEGTVVYLDSGGTARAVAQRPIGEAARARSGRNEKKPDPVPQVRFDPIGMGTPFRVILRRGGEGYRIEGDGDGAIRVELENGF